MEHPGKIIQAFSEALDLFLQRIFGGRLEVGFVGWAKQGSMEFISGYYSVKEEEF